MGSKTQDSKGLGEARRIDSPLGLNKRLFDLKEAAVYLGRPVFSVRTLIWSGALPVIKDGRKLYLDIHDLNGYIDKSKVTLA